MGKWVLPALSLMLVACAPPAEPRDASADRRVLRPDSAPDAEEPVFEDVFFPPVDAPSIDSGAELDATAPDSSSPTPDARPDSAPDARDAGSDARDAAPDACPANGYMDVSTWEPCGNICCPFIGRCRIDINDRPYCQG